MAIHNEEDSKYDYSLDESTDLEDLVSVESEDDTSDILDGLEEEEEEEDYALEDELDYQNPQIEDLS